MKKISIYFLKVVLVIILQGCSRGPIFYHSEASLPYYHSSTKTIFELIKDSSVTSSFFFGVIVAKDNDTLSYVLIAPSNKKYQFVTNLFDVNLSHSIPLLPQKVEEFLEILRFSAEKWAEKYDNKNGISYEFLVAPEHRVIPLSENVVRWYPTLKFYFENNKNGPIAYIVFGEGELQYFYKIDKLLAINDLYRLLNLAFNKCSN